MIQSGRKCTQNRKTVITQYVSKYINKDKRILDFGAGKNAVQTLILRKERFNVIAYDLPENRKYEPHNPLALDETYDVVMVSNILNIQASMLCIADVVAYIKASNLLNNNGIILFNYPSSPRYANVKTKEVEKY
jgi:hypothetical protein